MSLQHELDALRADFVRTARHQRRRHLGTAAACDYVIAPDRKIALAEIVLDYRERVEPEAIVTTLRTLRSSMTKTA